MAMIFVSCPSRALATAQDAMRACRWAGHTITFDWTPCLAHAREWTEEDLGDIATLLCDGVQRAEYVLVVIPEAGPSFGSGTELGLAWALGKPLAIVELGANHELRPGWEKHPFRVKHTRNLYPSLEAAIKHINTLAQAAEQWHRGGPLPSGVLAATQRHLARLDELDKQVF